MSEASVFSSHSPYWSAFVNTMAQVPIKYQKQNVLNFTVKFHRRICFYFIQHQSCLTSGKGGNKLCSRKLCRTSKRKPRKNRAPLVWEALIPISKKVAAFFRSLALSLTPGPVLPNKYLSSLKPNEMLLNFKSHVTCPVIRAALFLQRASRNQNC